MIPFGTKSVTLSMLIDVLTRSTQVKIASTDLWPQEMFTFLEMLALVESESSFGAYVCHGRPGGSTPTSDLVSLAGTVLPRPSVLVSSSISFFSSPRLDLSWEEVSVSELEKRFNVNLFCEKLTDWTSVVCVARRYANKQRVSVFMSFLPALATIRKAWNFK